jgi:hypothetical protein
MLKGVAALAPPKASGATGPDRPVIERDVEGIVTNAPKADPARDWPAYRHDVLRSNATACRAPAGLDVLWRRPIASARRPRRPRDWRDNPFSPGLITPPVIAGDLAVVAVCDQHRVEAVDARTGRPRWTFIADGRIDSAPTLANGLCLFGTRNGWVYCLRAADGRVAWRLRAAPLDERIVAAGQVESPWPVAGSVLVDGETAYFAAGRQYLADGGIRVFAVHTATGNVKWIKLIDAVTDDYHYYQAAGLEFDNYDLLFKEGPKITMSRWRFDPVTGEMDIVRYSGFYRTGGTGVMAPRGCWSYGPRMGRGAPGRKLKRPPTGFSGNMLISCTDDRLGLFRRDFRLEEGEQFDQQWYSERLRKRARDAGKEFTRAQRLAVGAKWKVARLTGKPIAAMVLAGDKCLLADETGQLRILSVADARPVTGAKLPAGPVWDGMAVAYNRLYVSTSDGALTCLGEASAD